MFPLQDNNLWWRKSKTGETLSLRLTSYESISVRSWDGATGRGARDDPGPHATGRAELAEDVGARAPHARDLGAAGTAGNCRRREDLIPILRRM